MQNWLSTLIQTKHFVGEQQTCHYRIQSRKMGNKCWQSQDRCSLHLSLVFILFLFHKGNSILCPGSCIFPSCFFIKKKISIPLPPPTPISFYINRLTPNHSTETTLIQSQPRLNTHLSNLNLICLVQQRLTLLLASLLE